MKKLKALEILKDLEKLDANIIWLDEDGNGIPMQNVIEAIAELETLQNRSCSNCKYYHDEVCCNDNSLLCADFVNENFYCNKWEVKNES
ncbi:hypothetical protein N5T67_03750 [Aliarcobacter butzleri]|uniref:hypothetical protein n=1 Tax=Aliarcobacter butzleri TaxID=28197 RepID=UPI0021B3499E|nr:hypothetical protein [Aliarcobacter butzleri]MCT7551947.1 hypothetical protein [Aliarcobacter butzleri]